MKNGPRYDWFVLKTICLTLAVFTIADCSCAQAMTFEKLSSGTSSKKAQKAAVDAIPFHELNQETQNKIAPILNKPSIYRRLPITAINVDPDYFVFLVRYPEVIVNIWKIMGVTKMVTSRTAPFQFTTNDGAGTISNVELLYGTPNLHVFYGEGTYEGPVLKRKLRGKCVMVLRTNYGQAADGSKTATSSLDVFLKVENATASLIARTLNPIVGKTADHNFIESLNFVQRLNDTTLKNGPGVQRMANRLTDLSADVRSNFVNLAGVVYDRKKDGQNGGEGPPAAPAGFRQQATGVPLSQAYPRANYNATFANGMNYYPRSRTYPVPVHPGVNGQTYRFSNYESAGTQPGQAQFRNPNPVRTADRSLPPIVSPHQQRNTGYQPPRYSSNVQQHRNR